MIGYYENMFAYAFLTGKCQNCISFPFSVTCLLVDFGIFPQYRIHFNVTPTNFNGKKVII